MKMGGQFAPGTGWSVCSGKQPKWELFSSGQFAPESGGQFDRILHWKTAIKEIRDILAVSVNAFLPVNTL